ncbi:MAG TPA: UDP-3-O-(3-hydroxymyristoyl)glucosamine N-acyltransferase [bacterium]|nr:UDP-3-O-(3-hydroxymyristoyl)glucosamine N-acyltransferase [bacterium]
MKISVKELAEKINGTVIGEPETVVSGISDLAHASENDVSFILGEKYLESAKNSKAPVIISDFLEKFENKILIRVENAKKAYIEVLMEFYPPGRPEAGISKNAAIGKNVEIGEDVHIGGFAVIKDGCRIGDSAVIMEGVFIGENVSIGSSTIINPNVSIYTGSRIGERCIVHSGAVIGADGFGFMPENGDIIKIPQIGYVEIGNDVEIGANCCIDRGAFGPTTIEDKVKLDNLIQVGHNVRIGEGTLIAAQSGIGGSSKIGKVCIIGGQVGFADHIRIGDNVHIGSQAGVSKDTTAGSVVTGTPARPIMQTRRAEANLGKISGIIKKIKALEEELDGLKKQK